MHEEADIALEADAEDASIRQHQVLSERQDGYCEQLGNPASRFAGTSQSTNGHDEVNGSERTQPAAEALDCVCRPMNTDGRRPVSVLVKLRPPAVDVSVDAEPQVKRGSDARKQSRLGRNQWPAHHGNS